MADTRRLFILHGSAIINADQYLPAPTDRAPFWITTVPGETLPERPLPPLRYSRVICGCLAGTAAEITAYLEGRLREAADRMHTIDWDAQNEILAGLDPNTADVGPVGHQVFLDIQAALDNGGVYRQDAFERDALRRVVAAYHSRRFRHAATDGLVPPTDDRARVTALIDALTVLRDDAIANGR